MVEDKARELGRLIGQSNEYKEVKRASDALNEDHDTVALLQKMEQLRINAQRMLQQGQRPTEEMERELDTLLGQIQGRTAYQRLLVASSSFLPPWNPKMVWMSRTSAAGSSSAAPAAERSR